MITISLPSDIEGPLTAEAQRQGTTPELLALESLRKLFVSPPVSGEPPGDATLQEINRFLYCVALSGGARSGSLGR
jgi:hypothetical protein